MEFICVIPKDLRVKQDVMLGRDLKEVGIIAGSMLTGFLVGLAIGAGNMVYGAIGLVVMGLITSLITQPISPKNNVLSYYKIIKKYNQSQKIYKTAPLSMHKELAKIMNLVDEKEAETV